MSLWSVWLNLSHVGSGFSVLLPCAHRFSCVIYPRVGERSFVCMCFFGWLMDGEGGDPEQHRWWKRASRAGPVRSEQLNLQPFQPVAPAPQNKWDFNSIRVQLLWPPHGRNYWTYPPPSWITPTRAVLDPHTDTGVVLHIAEFLHSLASQSCFTLSLIFCSLSAAALLSLSLHHTTPFRLSLPFSFFHSFFFSWGVARLPQNPHVRLEEFHMKTVHGHKSKQLRLQDKKILVLIKNYSYISCFSWEKDLRNLTCVSSFKWDLNFVSNISYQLIWTALWIHFESLWSYSIVWNICVCFFCCFFT